MICGFIIAACELWRGRRCDSQILATAREHYLVVPAGERSFCRMLAYWSLLHDPWAGERVSAPVGQTAGGGRNRMARWRPPAATLVVVSGAIVVSQLIVEIVEALGCRLWRWWEAPAAENLQLDQTLSLGLACVVVALGHGVAYYESSWHSIGRC